MQITVLGKSPSWQDADGACSGYLVQEGDYTLLLDCGNSVFGKLRRFRDYVDIHAVLISHLHADHFLDLVPFSYALIYAPRQQPVAVGRWPGTDDPARPELHAPTGSREMFRRMSGCWGDEDLIDRAFDLREFEGTEQMTLGPLSVRFCEVPHFTRTWAVQLTAAGRRFTYSADCSPNDELVRFAQDSDLMLIEATLPRPERTGERGHLTPREAGQLGRSAHAERLVMTHFSDELDAGWLRSEAVGGFGADVELAEEGTVYTV